MEALVEAFVMDRLILSSPSIKRAHRAGKTSFASIYGSKPRTTNYRRKKFLNFKGKENILKAAEKLMGDELCHTSRLFPVSSAAMTGTLCCELRTLVWATSVRYVCLYYDPREKLMQQTLPHECRHQSGQHSNGDSQWNARNTASMAIPSDERQPSDSTLQHDLQPITTGGQWLLSRWFKSWYKELEFWGVTVFLWTHFQTWMHVTSDHYKSSRCLSSISIKDTSTLPHYQLIKV